MEGKSILHSVRRAIALQPVDLFLSLRKFSARLKSQFYYAPQFAAFGKGSVIIAPIMISNPRFMRIGSNCIFRQGLRLEAVVADPGNPPELIIGDNVNIEQNVHIVVIGKVVIEDNVSITAGGAIMGGNHPFFDVHSPVKVGNRLSGAKSVTIIGAGSFLGVGAVIANNVKLGAGVIVGAQSVVKKNVPAHVVVEGNPARAILKYDTKEDRWLPC